MARSIDREGPRVGEIRRTALPDTWDGIKFEIGRCMKYVQDARREKVMIDAARLWATHGAEVLAQVAMKNGEEIPTYNNKVLFAWALDLTCRELFSYVNDPTAYEVTQKPERMVRMTRVPVDVLRKVMEPFYASMEELDQTFHRGSYSPRAVFIGDCDEPICVFLGLCACLDLGRPYLAFGGNGGQLHHVWSRIEIEGVKYDSDLTEPGFQFGDKLEFEHEDEVEIPL